MSAKKLIDQLRDLHERFIFQGGSQYANELADTIVRAYHKGRVDALRGRFDNDYLDHPKGTPEVTASRSRAAPTNAE